MNNRIVELLQRPQQIQLEDLSLLEKQIQETPYLQFVRALYLYGVHQHQPKNYKDVLTTTAAYTTDKKILFQFINQQSIKDSIKESNLAAIENQLIVVEDNVKEEVVIKDSAFEDPIAAQDTISDEVHDSIDSQPHEQEEISDSKENVSTEDNKELSKPPLKQEFRGYQLPDSVTLSSPIISEFVSVNGEVNRLLFEGEENFMNEPNTEVDLEASKESGTLITTDVVEAQLTSNFVDVEEQPEEQEIVTEELQQCITEELNSETVNQEQVTNEAINDPEEVVIKESKPEEPTELSYEGIDDFLPNIKFEVPKNHYSFLNPPKFDKPKPQEIQMPIITSELKSQVDLKVENQLEDFEVNNNTLDFGPFSDEEVSNTIEEFSPNVTENLEEELEAVEQIEAVNSWQPMMIDHNPLDALIGKIEIESNTEKDFISPKTVEEITKPENFVEDSKTEEVVIVVDNVQEEARPIMNVSFFSDHVSQINDEPIKTEESEAPVEEVKESQDVKDSNIGVFINTWQSWLKIDRAEEIAKDLEEKKVKAIDQFIENQPKISQLKEEAAFVIKEKNEDISHLMTETLVNLYIEQKLYSKAIKGFEIMISKTPEKTEYYQERINEVKEMRKPF